MKQVNALKESAQSLPPTGREEERVGIEGQADPSVIHRTLMATGMDEGEACAEMWRSGVTILQEHAKDWAMRVLLGLKAEDPMDLQIVHRVMDDHLHRRLDRLFVLDVMLTHAAFGSLENLEIHGSANLRTSLRDLDHLPDGLHVRGTLYLENDSERTGLANRLVVDDELLLNRCDRLSLLPEGLEAGTLRLSGCKRLRSLPRGLVVKKNLNLIDCASWDGVIPEDAKVGGKIFTNRHRPRLEENDNGECLMGGISLQEWRNLYGFGSCHGSVHA